MNSAQETVYERLRRHRDVLGQLSETAGMSWPEISDGRIITMTSPSPRHQLVAALVRDDLVPQIKAHDAQLVAVQSVDVENPRLGKLRIPDLVVVPIAAMDAQAVDPRDILLAVEIVSPSNASNDLVDKVRDYALMGIPHYLIVDPRFGTCTHHTWIENGRYEQSFDHAFGEDIAIGPWVVHTGSLKRYPERQPK
jgi:Uma2 family endonuclease